MSRLSKEFLSILNRSNKVAILTGAGVSAESGVKTFRDPDGLWSKFNPAELASVDGFMTNPELVWEWYQMRREIINSVKPNNGHFALAEMEKFFNSFILITQNVDRLHQQAGSKDVIELHGNIMENKCFKCLKPFTGELVFHDNKLPHCPVCGGLLRPAVVWFGEMLPPVALQASETAAMECDLFFSIGTSSEVYPAANLPVLAKQYGAYVVEVNPNKTSLTRIADYHLPYFSGDILPEIIDKLMNTISG